MTVPAGLRRACVAAVLLAPAAARADVIDFDHNAAGVALSNVPPDMGSAGPLTEAYADLGVHFSGPTAATGGRILSAGVSGTNFNYRPTSGNDVLAFNPKWPAPTPAGPETITFDHAWASVSMQVAVVSGSATFRMDAYDAAGDLLKSATQSVRAFTPVSVQADGIRRVVIANQTGGVGTFVFDDLTYSATPEPGPLALIAIVVPAALLRRLRTC